MNNFDALDIYAQIGDLKEIDYRNTLAIATIIEILIENELITREGFARKACLLDNMTIEELKNIRAMSR